MTGVVVIGAGQAATSFVAKFRKFDADTPLSIYGDESVIPYQRPPLSKKYATGDMEKSQLFLRPESWYTDKHIDVQTGVSVTSIDRGAHTIQLSDGRSIPWTKLAITTGSRVRKLPDTVTKGLSGIHYIRTLADADGFGMALQPGRRVIIIGGGYIGLEAAAVCAAKGMQVTLIEASDRILQRVACAETSDWFRTLHTEHGVDIREGLGLSHFEGQNGAVTGAMLTDGSLIEVDAAVIGIGIIPNTELAADCGLTVDNGIVVNGQCQTSDPDIYAAGDCAITDFKGLPTRLESVPNANDQASVAGHHAATGDVANYIAKPWFWSDQYNVKLQIAGLNRGYTNVVVRPGEKPQSVAHFYYADDQLVAVDALNMPRVYMVGKRMIEAGKNISRAQAADTDFDLKTLV